MEPTFTLASLFWLFVPMPLLILFSLISLFKQIRNEKRQKEVVVNMYQYQKKSESKLAIEKGRS